MVNRLPEPSFHRKVPITMLGGSVVHLVGGVLSPFARQRRAYVVAVSHRAVGRFSNLLLGCRFVFRGCGVVVVGAAEGVRQVGRGSVFADGGGRCELDGLCREEGSAHFGV